MANPDAVQAAKHGTDALRRWYDNSSDEHLDLSGADLRGVDLRWYNFAGANLEGVRFDEALLTGAYFGPATFRQVAPYVEHSDIPVRLVDTSFKDATLLAATFNYPVIGGSRFDGAYLGMATFRHADFAGVSFAGARFLNTLFASCDFASVKNLEAVEHLGPSHVDFGTLSLSRSLSPRFLRQIGIAPESSTRIADLLSAVAPQVAHSCFLSHSSLDKAFCDRLYSRLIDENVSVWYAPEEMRAGELISKQLLQAVQRQDKVLIVLSENSLRSNWVRNELRWALKREEQSETQVLFPVSLVPFSRLQAWELIDPDTGLDVAARIRSYYLPDFSSWQDESAFESAFCRLLRALRPVSAAL